MKNLLLILFLSFSAFIYAQDEIIIKGDIFNSGKVHCKVYAPDHNYRWGFQYYKTFKNSYKLKFEVKTELYLVVFQYEDDIKHLYLNLSEPGSYTANIDFDLLYHIVVYYEDIGNQYDSYLVSHQQVNDMVEQLSQQELDRKEELDRKKD
jgi:hypothetical protein